MRHNLGIPVFMELPDAKIEVLPWRVEKDKVYCCRCLDGVDRTFLHCRIGEVSVQISWNPAGRSITDAEWAAATGLEAWLNSKQA